MAESMELPTTAELLLRWDAQRPRSLQRQIGMSEIGGCRRAAGYRLAGTLPSSPSGSMQAVLGTAVHEMADDIAKQMRDEGELPANSNIGQELEFAGVMGHPDLIVPPVVRDVKTLGFGVQLENYKMNGPPRRHLWQVSLYAAAAILRGLHITTLQLDYIDRGSGRTWLWEGAFDTALVREAMAWLRTVRETPLQYLSRDFAPESPQCQHCPFQRPCWEGGVPGRDPRSVLYVEDPDAARWMEQLEAASKARKLAKALEDQAKGALDALRPNDKGSADIAIHGTGKVIHFSVSQPERPDLAQIRADYARAGFRMPVISGHSIRVTLKREEPDDE